MEIFGEEARLFVKDMGRRIASASTGLGGYLVRHFSVAFQPVIANCVIGTVSKNTFSGRIVSRRFFHLCFSFADLLLLLLVIVSRADS